MTSASVTTPPARPGDEAAASSPVEAAAAPRSRGRRDGIPAYLWCLLIGLVCDLINGNSQELKLPVSPDRLFIPLALILMLLDGRRRHLRWQGVHTLMVALVAWTVASMMWHGNLFDVVAVFALADRVVFPLILFATAPLFFDRPRHRDLLLKLLTLIGVYLGCTGIIEMVAVELAFPRYIANPELGMMFGRARGPFLAGDAMGVSAAICGFAGVLLFARVRTSGWRILGVIALVTGLTTTALSLTRATWFGAAVGMLVGGLMIPRLRKWIPIAFGAVVAAAVVALLAIPGVSDIFASRFNDQTSVDDRLGSNSAAMALLHDLPWTGIGWRRFYPDGADWFRISDDFAMNNVVVEVHNVVLSRAAELGIPAAVVFVAIWAFGPLRTFLSRTRGDLFGWRALGAAAFATWAVTGMMGPMAIPFPNYLAWLLAGVAAYPWAIADPTPEGLGHTTASLAYPGPVDEDAPINEDGGANDARDIEEPAAVSPA